MTFTHYAKCPNCLTIFGLRDKQLDATVGNVRCGNCFQLFELSACLVTPPTEKKVNHIHPVDKKKVPQKSEQKPSNTRVKAQYQIQPEISNHWPISKLLLETTVILSLLLTLFGQYVLFRQAHFQQFSVLRPAMTKLCYYSGCKLTPQTDPSAIHVLARQLSTHPIYDNALRLEAIISNTASFAQPPAILTLRFLDNNGRIMASRRFKPRDYLQTTPLENNLMPSLESISLQLDLIDPGNQCTGYTLSFS